jgi:hypothetical protein
VLRIALIYVRLCRKKREQGDTMAVQPGSARWQELVQQGIIRDGQRNWFLGDAALEIAPIGENGAHNGSEANLQQYADEIGVEFGSLNVYRKVAHAWPPVNRVTGTSWKVHSQLMGSKGLIRPGMTVTQAAAALGQKNVGRTGPKADIKDRVAAARDYMTDPEVAREVMADPDVAEAILADPVISQRASDIIERGAQTMADAREKAERREQRDRARNAGLRYLQAEILVRKSKQALLDAVSELTHVEDDEEGLALVRAAREEDKQAGALIDARLSSASGTDWDAELERLS